MVSPQSVRLSPARPGEGLPGEPWPRAAPETGGRPVATRPAWRRPLLVGASGIGLLLLAVLLRWGGFLGPDGGERPGGAPNPTPSVEQTPTTAEVVRAVAPSLVTVQASGGRSRSSLGTGVIANTDGTVLTAFHVVRGAKEIWLTFADGSRSVGVVARSNESTDTALLIPRALPEVVVPVVLGGRAEVGDEVIAIGNPLGLVGSTTTGVVSGLGRTTGEGDSALRGLVQFDAAVNHGSSGGPLLNAKGQVIGIVVALADPAGAGTFIGIGFAVPIGAAFGLDGQGVPGPQY